MRSHARGYLGGDKTVLVAQGIASGYLAVLVLALYTNTDISQRLHAGHSFFWGVCLLLLYWVSYLWLMATRGRIHNDPVIFALSDRGSLWTIAVDGIVRFACDMRSALISLAALITLGGVAALAVHALDGTQHPIAASKASQILASQWEEYEADVPKTIIELQPFRRAESVEFQMSGDWGEATLINLNPRINAWFLLKLWWPGAPDSLSYHLENPLPEAQTLTLSGARPYGLRISARGPRCGL